VRADELLSFAHRLDVPVSQIEPFDLLEGTTSLARVTEGVDAVLVGGSGRFSVTDEEPWLIPFFDTLGALADAQFPTFASCFGFQGLCVALGTEVRPDPEGSEVGTYRLCLTELGRADPLFSILPDEFDAQMGHKDRAMAVPRGAVHLASSPRCPVQALRIGTRVYATQFHPELTGADNRQRYERYLVEYSTAFGADRAEEILDAFRESPEASSLLGAFRRLLDDDATGLP
jgi:GMP synthase (glutamine-hydrolysing)